MKERNIQLNLLAKYLGNEYKSKPNSINRSQPILLHPQIKCTAELLPPKAALSIGAPLWLEEGLTSSRAFQVFRFQQGMRTTEETTPNETEFIECKWFSESVTTKKYHHMRNPSHSGFFSAESLQPFYRNVRLKKTEMVETTTLDHLFESGVLPAQKVAKINWLSIEDLWSANVLRGAQSILDHLDVLLLRAPTKSIGNSEFDTCTADNIASFLAPKGLKQIASATERHSDFSQLLYAKDWKSLANYQRNEQKNEVQALSTKMSLHLDQCSELQKNIEEKDSIIKGLENTNSTLTQKLRDISEEKSQRSEKIRSLKNEIQRLNSKHTDEVSSFEAFTTQASKEKENLSNQLSKAVSDIETLSKQNAQHLKRISSLDKEREVFQSELKTIKFTLSETYDAISDYANRIENNNRQIETVHDAIKETQKTLEDANSDFAVKQNAIQEKRQAELIEFFSDLRSQHLTTHAAIASLNTQQEYHDSRTGVTKVQHAELLSRVAEILSNQQAAVEMNRQTNSSMTEARLMQAIGLAGQKDKIESRLMRIASVAYQNQHYARAVEYYSILNEGFPENAWAIQGLAESLARLPSKLDSRWLPNELAERISEVGKWDAVVRLYRKALSFDSSICKSFTAAHPPSVESDTKQNLTEPIFIVGCGHSGTSILLRILGNHPDVWAITKESALFLRTDRAAQEHMREWDKSCRQSGAKRWIEKTPPHVFQIGRFLAMRPDAQFILMLRDGRDVVNSLKHRPGYENAQDRIERWVFDNVAGLPYWDHPQVKVVKYEDLISSPNETLDGICGFLNLPNYNALLNYHQHQENWYSEDIKKPELVQSPSDHNNLRNWQINQPLFDGRGKWKTEMSKNELDVFKNSQAQELLVEFGYESNKDW